MCPFLALRPAALNPFLIFCQRMDFPVAPCKVSSTRLFKKPEITRTIVGLELDRLTMVNLKLNSFHELVPDWIIVFVKNQRKSFSESSLIIFILY